MNYKHLRLLSSGLILGLAAAAMVGCSSGGGTTSGSTTSEDPEEGDKTIIKVHNFEGGYGRTWFDNVASEFTEAVKDVSFEDGKKGVKIKYTGDKKVYKDDIISAGFDIYFVEQGQYPYYVGHDYIEDITEAVTGDNPYETGKTILSKFDDNQKAFYKSSENYYAIPHYTGAYGINYNVKLFDDNGYYYKDGHPVVTESSSFGDIFIQNESDTKAAGPDGVKGTDDDGLPVTFAEFYRLCDYINSEGETALVWNTATFDSYYTQMIAAMAAAIDGRDNTMTSYSFTGTANDLVKMNADGTVALDGSGKIQLESSAITDREGYESIRTAGRYYSTKFFRKLYDNTNWQYRSTAQRTSGFTHKDAQNVFINGAQGKNVAMLFDGSWWQNEGADYFPTSGEKSLANSKFGVMPFPVPDSSYSYNSTFLDALNALQIVRKGVKTEKPGVYNACIRLLQFMNTDEQLAKFTVSTNTSRALKYTLTNDQINQLTYFGKRIYNNKNNENTQNIFPVSNTKTFVENQDTMIPSYYYKASVTYKPGGTGASTTKTNNYVCAFFGDSDASSMTDDNLFEGMYRYYKSNWANIYKA